VVVAQHDGGFDRAAIEIIEHFARGRHPHLQHQLRLGMAHALQQQRQLGAHDVMADADHESALFQPERAERAVMGGDEMARRHEKGIAVGRQPHQPRRPLQQPPAERVLQPLDLQAHSRLGRVHGLGGAGEALEVCCQNKGLDSLHIQRSHGFHPFHSEIIEMLFNAILQ
jgi:hypothetical protein